MRQQRPRIHLPYCLEMEAKGPLRAEVVSGSVGGVVGGPVGDPDGVAPQLKVASLSVPAERKSTKPGWLVVMVLLIQA